MVVEWFCGLKTSIEVSEVSVKESVEDEIDVIPEEHILPNFKA
jgi:hypothetical protein